MTQFSIDELLKKHAEALALTWLAGQEGSYRNILLTADRKLANVGFLNPIHPHQIQIIGPYELAYINALAKNVYQTSIKPLFDNKLRSG